MPLQARRSLAVYEKDIGLRRGAGIRTCDVQFEPRVPALEEDAAML
jgi:hypothetical protein